MPSNHARERALDYAMLRLDPVPQPVLILRAQSSCTVMFAVYSSGTMPGVLETRGRISRLRRRQNARGILDRPQVDEISFLEHSKHCNARILELSL